MSNAGSSLGCLQLSRSIDRDSPEILRFIDVLADCQSLRRLGSCALNMCYVADGRMDAYWATCVQACDSAAGIVIARESGAVITRFDGSGLDDWLPRFCVSGSVQLQSQLTSILGGIR